MTLPSSHKSHKKSLSQVPQINIWSTSSMRRYQRDSGNTWNIYYYSLAFNSRFPMAFLSVPPIAGCILELSLTKRACISVVTTVTMLLYIGRKFSCQQCWLIVHVLSDTRCDPLMRRKTSSQKITLSSGWFSVLMTSHKSNPWLSQ